MNRRSIGWGFVDQGFSSATNFGLTVLAGRLLGPHGLGSIVVGFTFYLLALGFQRSLISDPLVAVSAALGERERRTQAQHALTLTLLGALFSAILMVILGVALPASSGSGLLYLGPWLAAALVQDVCRAILFRDQRGQAAAVNDGTWLAIMALALPVALSYPSGWTVAGVWGGGAAVSALLGIAQVGLLPSTLALSLDWWRKRASGLARWLGAGSVVYALGANASIFVLAGILGSSALGGLQATMAAFGPLSLIIPALSLPGLPMITRALAKSRGEALEVTLRLAGIATVATATYSAIFFADPGLLGRIFGASFSGFERLVLPIGIAQIAAALTVGFVLFLQADGRGRALFLCRIVYSVATLVLLTTFALAWGVVGAAWAGAAAAAIGSGAIAIATLGGLRGGRTSGARLDLLPTHLRDG